MQVNNITPMNMKRTNFVQDQKPNSQNQIENTTEKYTAKLPSTQNYLAFTGGYSLNLADTILNLDKLAAKDSSIYPKNIREWAGMVLEAGNNVKSTLIDVHKKYYEALKNCVSLEDVKAKFPEFSDVISDSEVEFSKNSFGYDVKHGNLEYFDKDEDISLQILKLYYGEGFSLNDLKNYTDGKDIYYTMKKLNIPCQNKNYGHILKFSDPEYNERLTAEMTYKRRLTLDAKAQQEGEPVHIPRGPLSAEHKEHISIALKKYYAENPERIYEMSAKQRDYYAKNPEKAREFSRVLNKAWNIFGADRIKVALSKFMKKNGQSNFQPETSPLEMTKEQAKLMKKFWADNEWAKKAFSKNMEFSWKKVKEENETFYSIDFIPKTLVHKIEKELNLPQGKLNCSTLINPYTQESKLDEFSSNIVHAYDEKNDYADVMADTYQYAVFLIFDKLEKTPQLTKTKYGSKIRDFAGVIINKNSKENDGHAYKVQTTQETLEDLQILALTAVDSGDKRLIDIINQAIDVSYTEVAKFHNGEYKGILK